ncbi:hypothetical protein Tco_0111414, partial [Tanacetum coccineum]
MKQDQEFVTRDNDEQPADKEVTKADCQVALAKEPPTSFDEFNDTTFDFSAFVMNQLKIPNLTQEILVGPAFKLLKGTCKSITELEYHLEECSKATTERLDWHDPENKPYPFDLRKPLPLIQDHQGRQIIPKAYFINKDLEYLKGGDLSRRYSTFVTKTKAATYELKWIEDLVYELWSPVVEKYDQHAYFGTSHWGPKCQSFYGYASNLTSSKDVYSRRRIIVVIKLTIMKNNTERDVAAKECLVTELGVTNHRKRQKEALLDRYRALGMNIDDATMLSAGLIGLVSLVKIVKKMVTRQQKRQRHQKPFGITFWQ